MSVRHRVAWAYAVALAGLLSSFSAFGARAEPAPPPGAVVARGSFFQIYVLKKAERAVDAGYVERTYQVTIVARTTKHGIQRFSQRITTLDADLLLPASWEVADLDGDGLDDLRYLAQQTKSGCRVWPALRWEKDRERFTSGGSKLARHTDARGKQVQSCALR